MAYAFDAHTGDLLWTNAVAHQGVNTSFASHGGKLFYSLSATDAVKVADVKAAGARGASATADRGKAYTTAEAKAVCADLTTGAVAWEVAGTHDQFASPILAAGKLVAIGAGGKVCLFNAADGKLLGSANVGALRCTSPALAGTRLFIPTAKGVSCYDLEQNRDKSNVSSVACSSVNRERVQLLTFASDSRMLPSYLR